MRATSGKLRLQTVAGAAVVYLLLGMAGCTTDDKTDYCKNHYVHHDQHRATIANLDIVLQADGTLHSDMRVPRVLASNSANDAVAELFDDPDRIFQLSTAGKCNPGTSIVDNDGTNVQLRYTMECGVDNRIGTVEVGLFELLPELDEVLVSVTTPATNKTFVISRQCDNPIFRFE